MGTPPPKKKKSHGARRPPENAATKVTGTERSGEAKEEKKNQLFPRRNVPRNFVSL